MYFSVVYEKSIPLSPEKNPVQKFRFWSSFFSGLLLTLMFCCSLAYGENLYWMGGVSTDWGTADNWDPAIVPGEEDSVTIAATVRMPVLNEAATVTGVTITDGTLTVNGNLTASTLTQLGGVLTGTGEVTAQNITWSGGTMSGSGKTIVPVDGTMAVMDGVTAAFHHLDGRTLINNGSVLLSGYAYLSETNNVCILNNGVFDFQGASGSIVWHIKGAVGSFINHGLLKKTINTNKAKIDLAFVNNGVVQVDVGTLSFSPKGNDAGVDSDTSSYMVASGATVQFDLGDNTKSFDPDAISGSGTVDFAGGVSDFGNHDVTFNHTNVSISGGTLTFNKTFSVNTMAMSGGSLTGSGTLTAQTFDWAGGSMSGSGKTIIPSDGTMNMTWSGPDVLSLDGRTVINNGSVLLYWEFYLYEMNNGQIINNGVFDLQGNHVIFHRSGEVGSFTNNGTLKKSGGVGAFEAADIQMSFTNNGNVHVSKGTLRFSPAGSNTGVDTRAAKYLVDADATLQFSFGDKTKNFDLSFIGGAGTVEFESGISDFGNSDANFSDLKLTGTLTGSGTFTAQNTTISGGTLTGNGTLITQTLYWSCSTMSGAGKTIIPEGGNATVHDYAYLDERTLVNNGSFIVDGHTGLYERNNGQIINNGIFDFQGYKGYYQKISHSSGPLGSFTNNGTLKRSSGTGTAFIDIPFTNNGTIQADSGVLDFNASLLNALEGKIRGQATLDLSNAAFTNLGVTQPGASGPGKLTVMGNYPSPASGSLNLRLGGKAVGTSYDQLSVSGNVTLGGLLNVSLDDSFTPVAGNCFTLLTAKGASGITGTFSKVNLPELPAGKEWDLVIDKTALTLTVRPISGISVSPLAYDFGSVVFNESSTVQTFTITNKGASDLVINSLTSSGIDPGMFYVTEGTCGTLPKTVAAGNSCTFDVTFVPTVAEAAEATLEVTSDDPQNAIMEIPLSGKGLYKLTTVVKGGQGAITGPNGVVAGEEAVFNIVPETDYRFKTLTDNGQVVTPVFGQPAGTFIYTLTNISQAHLITVRFVAKTGTTGDCNNDGRVSVAEVQGAINMYLGLKPVEACVDNNDDGSVSLVEIQRAINQNLGL